MKRFSDLTSEDEAAWIEAATRFALIYGEPLTLGWLVERSLAQDERDFRSMRVALHLGLIEVACADTQGVICEYLQHAIAHE